MNRFLTLAGLLVAVIQSACAQFLLSQGYPQGGTVIFGTGGFSTSGSTRSGSAGGNPSEVEGPISYHWYWADSGAAPAYVILTISASASWGGIGGNCSDGMQDPEKDGGGPPPAPPSSGGSSGTHYVLQAVAGDGTVSYSVNPSAICTSGGTGVSVTITVSPLTVILQGVTDFNNAHNILVGQLCTASLGGLPSGVTAGNFTWTVPGNIYNTWTASMNSASLNTTIPLNNTTASWTWASCGGLDDGPHYATVQCSFTLYANGASIGSANAQASLNVWRPYQAIAGTFAGPVWINPPSPTGVQAATSTGSPGAQITGTLGTPTPFGTGAGAFCQLVSLNNSMSYHGYTFWSDITSGFALDLAPGDSNWPYNPPFAAALVNGVGSSQTMTDEPGLESFSITPFTADSYSLSFTFFTYLMYQPPSGQWVPSARDYWQFNTSAGSPWPATPPGSCREIQSDLTDQFPIWSSYHMSTA